MFLLQIFHLTVIANGIPPARNITISAEDLPKEGKRIELLIPITLSDPAYVEYNENVEGCEALAADTEIASCCGKLVVEMVQ